MFFGRRAKNLKMNTLFGDAWWLSLVAIGCRADFFLENGWWHVPCQIHVEKLTISMILGRRAKNPKMSNLVGPCRHPR